MTKSFYFEIDAAAERAIDGETLEPCSCGVTVELNDYTEEEDDSHVQERIRLALAVDLDLRAEWIRSISESKYKIEYGELLN